MGFFKDVAGKIGAGGLFGFIGGSAMDLGANMISTKYGADLQEAANRESAQYNREQNIEMFNRQVAENANVFEKNKKLNEEIWKREVAYANQRWEEEKAYNNDLWAKQNEYNSPAAQMQRLRDAGLNPNLMYGQGTTGNTTVIKAGAPPGAELEAAELQPARIEAARLESSDRGRIMMDGLRQYIAMRGQDLTTQNMAVQRDLTEAQTEVAHATAERVRAEKKRTETETAILEREGKLAAYGGTSIKTTGGIWPQTRRDIKLLKESLQYIGGRTSKYVRDAAKRIYSAIDGGTQPMPKGIHEEW